MFVVTVARRPPTRGAVAANVLAHGTGALHIRASRIPVAADEPDSGAMFYRNRGLAMPTNRQNYFGSSDRMCVATPIDGGRWPANLILGHHSLCRQQGAEWTCGAGCPIAALHVLDGADRYFKQVAR